LNADPRLPSTESVGLPKGKYLATIQEGKGQMVVFSDALPRLTYVDAQDRIAQITAEQREALAGLRKVVEQFTVTSSDAPPRVAICPMGGRVAVVNYTELFVACRLVGLGGMASRLRKVFGTAGAILSSDAATLRLPPHSLLIVGQ
jgi:hypothetical protein